MVINRKSGKKNKRIRIDQANVFYNYAIGFETHSIDLIRTAGKLLKKGIAKAVFFSDLKFFYTDEDGEVQLEWIRPDSRQWDDNWKIELDSKIPTDITADLILAIEVSFYEHRIEGPEMRSIPPYLRASLPPIMLESDESHLPIYASIKLFDDGIAILSFQLDSSWDGVDEEYFISNVVNIYQCYFKSIWVDSRIQRLDAETILPTAYQEDISLARNPIGGRKVNKLLWKMRKESRDFLNRDLSEEGQQFKIGDEQWTLHPIVGSKKQDSWESSLDLCRSEYSNALGSLLVHGRKERKYNDESSYSWQGRPSVVLMRFHKQPKNKDDLLKFFAPSLSRILLRSPEIELPPDLPPDLRPFGDYCFHGNRAVLLWTWLLPHGAITDAWKEPATRAMLMEHQTRSEHIEYHNMRIIRACETAQSPLYNNHLMEAYETLASVDNVIHSSSQAGEITEALTYLLEEIGTMKMVAPAKEAARWHLDELRYRSDKRRIQGDRLLSFVFGLVGASGLAKFVIQPFLIIIWPGLPSEIATLVAFAIACLIVISIAIPIWFLNR